MNDNLLTPATLAPLVYKPTAEAVRQQLRRDPSALPPFVKIGGRIYWRKSDVQKWLDDRFSKVEGESV